METDLFGISDSPDTTKNAATEAAKATRKTAPKDQASPLAERLRPKTIDEVVGQKHLLGPGKPLRSAFENAHPHSMILWGPPGVGKTSIARSVAKALNRKYVRMSLGGVKDEAEIRGHRRTYIGAMPGRIMNAMKQVGTINPLMLLDEVDKLFVSYNGDPAAALLEVLDGEQNFTFRDHYVEMPYDLSKVLFMCTANSLEPIPGPLRDRMEIIELSGYTSNEKFHIAKDYLVKKSMKNNGLDDNDLTISDDAIEAVIEYYAREAGVRKLEQQIGKICRKAVSYTHLTLPTT